jgi:hypothetical protein
MDGSSVILIVMPIVIPLVIFAGHPPCRISLTVIPGERTETCIRRSRHDKAAGR